MNEKMMQEWKKQDYTMFVIHVPKKAPKLCIHNWLDNSYAYTNEERCYIAIGRKGEQWPIRAQDVRKYLAMDGTKLVPEDLPLWEAVQVRTDTTGPHIKAYIATEREVFPAPASWGMTEPLVAEPGDAVAFTLLPNGEPNPEDKYRIEGDTFRNTYELV